MTASAPPNRLRSCRSLFFVALLAMTSTSTPSFADDGDSVEMLVVQGVEKLRDGDYEAARQAFAAAYLRDPRSATLLKLGLAELESGHPVEAARHFRVYIDRPDAPEDKVDAILRKWLPSAEAQTSRLKIDAPAGAEIAVDGHVEGRAPLGLIDVSAGRHDVTAREGSWSQSLQVVTVAGASPESLHFEQPVSPSAPTLAPAAVARMTSSPADSRPSAARLMVVLGIGSGALIAAGFGVAFAVASWNQAHEVATLRAAIRNPADSQCRAPNMDPGCPALQSELDAQSKDAQLSNALYIGSGVLAAAALTTWLVWPAPKSHKRVGISAHLVPVMDRNRTGVALDGAW